MPAGTAERGTGSAPLPPSHLSSRATYEGVGRSQPPFSLKIWSAVFLIAVVRGRLRSLSEARDKPVTKPESARVSYQDEVAVATSLEEPCEICDGRGRPQPAGEDDDDPPRASRRRPWAMAHGRAGMAAARLPPKSEKKSEVFLGEKKMRILL